MQTAGEIVAGKDRVRAAGTPAEKMAAILDVVSQVPSGTKRETGQKCDKCGAALIGWIGTNSGKRLLRHEPGGCAPFGRWLDQDSLETIL